MDLADQSPAERHRVVAAGFAEVVAGTTDWTAPAPVAGWTARDVVEHLVTWFPAFLAAGGVELTAGPSVDDDPVAAWWHHTDQVQTLLDSPAATREFTHPRAGTHQLDRAVDMFYTADVFMHTWDLGRAGSQDVRLDPGFCTQLLEGMQAIEDLIRSSGQYGPAHPVPDGADVQTRMLGFIGRDPDWRP